jgi:steroid delta-isomerase-like uncharacterized protein
MYRFVSSVILAILLAAPALAAPPQSTNKQLTQRFYDEVCNKGNMAVVDELVADNFVEHQPFPGIAPNREGVKQVFTMLRTAFPDLKCDVQYMVEEGDKVAIYLMMSGTQKGEFMGMPASGKPFSTPCIDIIRIVNKRAVEHWGVVDSGDIMQQLGAVPPSEKTGK